MMQSIEIVGKIGSMAMIRKADSDIDYNIISRIAGELRPGIAWVTSGAAEIGRLDYMKRAGRELVGDPQEVKADYCAQGQSILMQQYRQYARPEYGIRQLLVEHQHFNDPVKRAHIRALLTRAAEQGAVPVINYNDSVSDEEIRKMELQSLRETTGHAVECVDNDETAAVVSEIVGAKYLVILSSTEGIYRDPLDPASLVQDVVMGDGAQLVQAVRGLQQHCVGASRQGANGAKAKLEFALPPALRGTTVIIGHARHGIHKLLHGEVPCTRIGIR